MSADTKPLSERVASLAAWFADDSPGDAHQKGNCAKDIAAEIRGLEERCRRAESAANSVATRVWTLPNGSVALRLRSGQTQVWRRVAGSTWLERVVP